MNQDIHSTMAPPKTFYLAQKRAYLANLTMVAYGGII
jgi:hypothetical protein